MSNVHQFLLAVLLLWFGIGPSVTSAIAADLHVDPVTGDNANDGQSAPTKTISWAVRIAKPGDTIHLKPIVYHDLAEFYDKQGEPQLPIILDGHGATLDGCDPLKPEGWVEMGNGTGICDTGTSETTYRNVFIDRCLGFDLFFLQQGVYSVSDAYIRSSSPRPLYLQSDPAAPGFEGKALPPCILTLDNVWIDRVAGPPADIRVNANCRLTATRSTFTNLDLQVVNGEVTLECCVLNGSISTCPLVFLVIHSVSHRQWPQRQNVLRSYRQMP